jgi:2'-5' RNA ligase
MSSETLRLFIAAELPGVVRGAMQATQLALRGGRPSVKWVAPEAMHLTLRFLGDVAAPVAERIAQELHSALAGRAAPRLRLMPAGGFPDMRRPSVVWLGVGGEIDELHVLYAAVEQMLAPFGFAPETRPFRPHLTLGRVRREAGNAERAALGASIQHLPAPDQTPWQIEHILLFQSELLPSGPRYTALSDVALALGI